LYKNAAATTQELELQLQASVIRRMASTNKLVVLAFFIFVCAVFDTTSPAHSEALLTLGQQFEQALVKHHHRNFTSPTKEPL